MAATCSACCSPNVVRCGNCHRAWCEHCDPAPSALCHYCHGRGYSLAPISWSAEEDHAAFLGGCHGKNAGTWVVDGNTSTFTLRVIILADEEGDPSFWDNYPGTGFSGEWADSYSLADLARDVEVDERDPRFADCVSAYEDAHADAWRDEVVRSARAMLPEGES